MEKIKRSYQRVVLAYFSGTGGTEYAAESMERQLKEQGIKVTKKNIAKDPDISKEKWDLLIILSPVYAFRLAELTEQWVKKLPSGNHKPAAILSVSGGGEVSPNTACRVPCKKHLKKRNYDVVYEAMLVMPSNFAAQAESQINLALFTVLPDKIRGIIKDLMEGKKRLTTPQGKDRLITAFGIAEHMGARIFGSRLTANSDCNQCGQCIRECPKKNIRMKHGRPGFGFRCMWCMKCIYACSRSAIVPGVMKSAVLKDGFDIKSMSRKANQKPPKAKYNAASDQQWSGVIKYLNE
ncbi:EFR1 family ferrodoxin [Lacrimispora sp.]|uniref:EFR1 family ferrodoxin n=1 Tax=Lacrimispora sp. TaxID=2719234 RepID=UPI0039939E2C